MATVTLVSVEEYLELPPREDGLIDELIEGKIPLSPSAKPLHAKIVCRLLHLFKKRTVVVQDAEGQTEVRCGESLTFAGASISVAAIFEGL